MMKYEARHKVSFPGEQHVTKGDTCAYLFHVKYCKIIIYIKITFFERKNKDNRFS